jgi:hypothetical protein
MPHYNDQGVTVGIGVAVGTGVAVGLGVGVAVGVGVGVKGELGVRAGVAIGVGEGKAAASSGKSVPAKTGAMMIPAAIGVGVGVGVAVGMVAVGIAVGVGVTSPSLLYVTKRIAPLTGAIVTVAGPAISTCLIVSGENADGGLGAGVGDIALSTRAAARTFAVCPFSFVTVTTPR